MAMEMLLKLFIGSATVDIKQKELNCPEVHLKAVVERQTREYRLG